MNGGVRVSAIVCVAVLSGERSSAQQVVPPVSEVESFERQWFFMAENDVATFSDGDYTSGLRFGIARESDPDGENALVRGLTWMTGGLHGSPLRLFSGLADPEVTEFTTGWSLTHTIFTPEDKLARRPAGGERPYAGWLGLSFSATSRDDNAASSVGLSLGLTGEAAFGEEVQDAVHDLLSSQEYHGWDSQLPTEFTVNLHFDRKHRYSWLDGLALGCLEVDGYFEWGGELGTYRTAGYLGTHVRAGINLPGRHPARLLDLGTSSNRFFSGSGEEGDWSLYMFGGVRGSLVAHDITLDGPLFTSWDEAVDSEPWVVELVWGVGVRWKSWDMTLAVVGRTDEFDGQNDEHDFASMMVRKSY